MMKKIKTAKENIAADRKQLKQMDEAVDQIMARSTSEGGADKANAVRKSQQRDRAALAKDVEANQKLIAKLNDEAAPIRAEVRKVEAEVGPIKYIAKFIYGEEGANEGMLEKAVTWIIILIVVVFDPLAVIMLIASQMTFAWHNKGKDPLAEEDNDDYLVHETVPVYVTDVSEPPTEEELDPEVEVPPAVIEEPIIPVGHVDHEQAEIDHSQAAIAQPKAVESETGLDRWNQMIAEAEAEVAKDGSTVEERVARGESYIDGNGNEIEFDDELLKKRRT